MKFQDHHQAAERGDTIPIALAQRSRQLQQAAIQSLRMKELKAAAKEIVRLLK